MAPVHKECTDYDPDNKQLTGQGPEQRLQKKTREEERDEHCPLLLRRMAFEGIQTRMGGVGR